MNETLVLANNTLVPGNFASSNPSELSCAAFDPTQGAFYVGSEMGVTGYTGQDNIFAISPVSHKVVSIASGGQGPDGLAFDSGKGEIFVADSNANQVVVLNASTNLAVATIPLFPLSDPGAEAYDSSTGQIFVADQDVDSVGVISDSTNSELEAIVVGSQPNGIAVDPSTGEIYVANSGSDNVSVISQVTDKVVANIPVGAYPEGIADIEGQGEVAVANSGSSNVSLISDTTNKVVGTVSLGAAPEDVGFDGSLDDLFVTEFQATAVISLPSQLVVATPSTGVGPSILAIDEAQGEVTVASWESSNLTFISTATDADVASLQLSTSPQPVVVDPSTGDVFVGDFSSTNLYEVSGSSNRAVAMENVGLWPAALVYDPAKQEIFSADYGPGSVSVFSVPLGRDVAFVNVGMNPDALAYDSTDGTIYVANSGSSNVSVISDQTDHVVATINVGSYPEGIAWDNRSNVMYVSNAGSDNVSVISASSRSVVASLPVGSSPEGIAFDIEADEVFVGNSNSNNISVISALTNAVVRQFSCPGSPTYLSIANRTRTLVVVMEQNWKVSLVSTSSDRILSNISTGAGPAGAAYNPVLGNLYVSNELQGTLSIIQLGAWASGPVITSFSSSPSPLLIGSSASLVVQASGGVGSLIESFSGLPQGCSSSDTSILSCTPSVVGNYTVRVYVNDSLGNSTTATVSLSVYSLPVISSFTTEPSSIELGNWTDLSVEANQGYGRLSFAYSGLPMGCSSQDEPILSCLPTSPGTYSVRVYANDSLGDSATNTTVLTVSQPPPGPLILSFVAVPEVLTLGAWTNFSLLAVGGAGSLTYFYAGLPPGCNSANSTSFACRPTSIGSYVVTAFVNDTLGRTGTMSLTLTVNSTSSPPRKAPSSGRFGLSVLEIDALVALLLAIVAIMAIVILRRRGRSRERDSKGRAPPEVPPQLRTEKLWADSEPTRLSPDANTESASPRSHDTPSDPMASGAPSRKEKEDTEARTPEVS